ncbi:MAG: lysylphosphatidylglycerol synthase domain-containing protein, partial [Betaproteobacteria bacterium]
LLAAIVVAPFVPWPIGWLRRLPGRAGERIADLWLRLRAPGSVLRRRLVQSLALSMVVQVLSATALWACAGALGVDIPYVIMLAAAAPIFVMAALPLGIAGFGTRELAAVAILALAVVAAGLAAGTGLLYGICGVIQGMLAAPLFLLPSRGP